jgi:hypothetical protein
MQFKKEELLKRKQEIEAEVAGRIIEAMGSVDFEEWLDDEELIEYKFIKNKLYDIEWEEGRG